ncbi:MAG: amino acid permease [Bacteroidales bacterium]
MENRKKFGAFGGVFTPSILTILGVIMYMRLGWVVGQAGLVGTLLIIVLAHVVSVSTGLSISSIATDKQVKEGGIYYMLSRSLGLPMGGAIGIALFIATALGISLYIVGFSENFLGIEAIRNFLNLGTGLNDIRSTGTAVVIILTILGLISTSVVIKTQYFILGAIALSLISVFVGFLWEPVSNPETILKFPASNSLPMAAVFAVFFPAVTGFTAGVAMSGDLRNPKKDIPRGTISAIAVGLLVYVSLTLVMAIFMPRDVLLNDKNFLMHSAWIGGLVVAGIWGATLSSALSGLLGGPRIMQAIALDKIMPRFLAKGSGANNEPRAAIIITFLIAEAGILIGDLNAIAELVTMFYLTSYGFINLAYVLESWASTDFRPSMRVPHWIGILGFVVTFGIMFYLNPLAMIISLVLMLGIYFILKRRELQLAPGDVWQSVWSALMRTSLHRMDRKGLEDRNWRPNIILFSGGTQNRPYLIEFGKAMVGKHGLLSNFDLVEQNGNDQNILPKHKQAESPTKDDNNTYGVFSRKQTVSNIYDAIVNITNNYGFAGVEPNTVLMGWARYTRNPDSFLKMIKKLQEMDMNVLLMDYDKTKGFGNYKTIDIWWRGGASNSHLALQLVKFLWLSDEWKNARLRLMIINPVNQQKENIYLETEHILSNLRVKADIKIINNEIENKPLNDIIRVESVNSDLIFLGLSHIQKENTEEYIQNINNLCEGLGTVILVSASSKIKPIELNADIHKLQQAKVSNKVTRIVRESDKLPELKLPEKQILASQIQKTKEDLLESTNRVKVNALVKLFENNAQLLINIKNIIHETARSVSKTDNKTEKYDRAKRLLQIKQKMLSSIGNELIRIRDKQLKEQKDLLQDAIQTLMHENEAIIESQPEKIKVHLTEDDLRIHPKDRSRLKLYKKRKKLYYQLTGQKPTKIIHYRQLLKEHFPITTHYTLNTILEQWGVICGQFAVELQKTIEKIDINFKGFIDRETTTEEEGEKLRMQLLKDALETIQNLSESQQSSLKHLLPKAQEKTIEALNSLSSHLSHIDARTKANDEILNKNEKLLKKTTKWLSGIPQKWYSNQILFYNSILLETYLLQFSSRVQTIFNDIRKETETKLQTLTDKKQQQILDRVNNLLIHKQEQELQLEQELDFDENNHYYNFFRNILDSASRRIRLGARLFPASITLMSEDSFNEFHNQQYSKVTTVRLSINRFMDYLIQSELIGPLQNITQKLPETITQNNRQIREHVRMLDFSFSENKEEFNEEEMTDFIHHHARNIEAVIKQTRKLREETVLQLSERTSSFAEDLQFSIFRHKAFHSRQYIRTTEKERTLPRLQKQLKKFFQSSLLKLSNLYYRRSSLLLAQQLNLEYKRKKARIEDILDIVEASRNDRQIMNTLPFYYKQLFLRRHNHLTDFHVGREEQLNKAKKALQRYNSGYKGAFLISGESYSGKSFLAQYVVNKLIYNNNLLIVNPPHSGSINRSDFKQALIAATDKSGEYDDIFSNLPANSVILFEDIDLWWENTPDGMHIIELIMHIIRKYSDQYLFIVTLNKHTFSLINKMNNIEHSFLSLIHCEPMDAKDLDKAIMLRHASGNLKFKLGKQPENKLKPQARARLFSRYFSYSRGNIGIALQTWIHNIRAINNGIIQITEPKIPDLEKLKHLEPKWYITISQIILHRRVTEEKLSRIMRFSLQEAKDQIQALKLSGIIIENGKEVFEINPVIYPHLMTKLNEMKII